MGKKASAIGSFFGGIANNPGIVILGLALGGLLIFRKDITNFLDKGIGNITLPEIKLPDITFPEFNFPDFNFPEFPSFPDFSNIFQGFQDQLSSIAGQVVDLQGSQVTIPPDTMVNPDGTVTSTTPPTIDTGLPMGSPENLFGELRPLVFDTLINIGVPLPLATEILGGAKTFEDLQVILNQANTGIFTQLQGTLDILDQPVVQPSPIVQPVSSFLLDDPQQFTGGGIGFIGGSIFETPIANLTLSQIIDMFNVTASQASNILAIAKDDFGDFDFGTNIGGILPGLPGIQGTNVSDPQFQGLTAEQIALFLTGGNIQNF